MKGRRRARRTALQALYELDQSHHALDDVLAGRLHDFYRTAATGGLAPDDQRIVEALMVDYPSGEVPELNAQALVARYGIAAARAQVVAVFLRRLRPHAAYGVAIVRGVMANRALLDGVIARIAPEWPVDQMAPIDRNVLRIALWEIGSEASPVRVAINEAVELARTFSGEGSRRMVNGALGAYTTSDLPLELESERT